MSNNDRSGRDKRGRWTKGFCPNPRGRPRKPPEISDADVGWFKQGVVEVNINGEKRKLTRHELLLHTMFEQAIKGRSVMIAKKLLDSFDKVELLMAQANAALRRDSEAFLEDLHERGKYDEKRAEEIHEFKELLAYGRKTKIRKPRFRKNSAFANWRKGPKPQSLLDLEKQEEAELLAEEQARARRHGLKVDADDDDKEGG